jgi:hypothetical protein
MATVDDEFLHMIVTFSPGTFDPNDYRFILYLSGFQLRSDTFEPAPWWGGSIGIANVYRINSLLGSVPIDFRADSFGLAVPLALLGNDDGSLLYRLRVFDSRKDGSVNNWDYAPDTGFACASRDADDDGHQDCLDNCPADANPGQTDTDGNGIGDACNDFEDADGDDFADVLDNCPLHPNPDQADTDGKGIGDACSALLDDILLIPPPLSVPRRSRLRSNDTAFAFFEGRTLLEEDQTVDVSLPGSYAGVQRLTPDTILAGTTVDAFYVLFDPVDSNSALATGSISFDQVVLGIILSDSELDDSNSSLGHPRTQYASCVACSPNVHHDTVTLSPDRRTVSIEFAGAGNRIRVLVLSSCPSSSDSDEDNDGTPKCAENCPQVPNPDQTDTDGNGTGDACNDFEDRDGDDFADSLDNCPAQPNPSQENSDLDGFGAACECNDSYSRVFPGAREVCDGVNNDCNHPTWPSLVDTIDSDADGDGLKACEGDNCPAVFNPAQVDRDEDGLGDLCDLFPDDPGNPIAFTVNTTRDAIDRDPADWSCADELGDCTLRAAIMQSNALPGQQTVSLPVGTYALTILGPDEDAGATGDLDVRDGLVLVGAAAEETIIDGNGIDRVLEIAGEPLLPSEISGITITGGSGQMLETHEHWSAGGLYMAGVEVLLSGMIFRGNTSKHSGAIGLVDSELIVTNSLFEANQGWYTIGGPDDGMGAVTMFSSVIRDNVARAAVSLDLGRVEISDTLITRNGAEGQTSWGVSVREGLVHISHSSITDNDGAGLRLSQSDGDVSNSTISGNGGSGIDCFDSSGVLRNSTVSGNGLLGIDFRSSSNDVLLSILSSTITANHAGGLYFESGEFLALFGLIGNSITADNGGPDCFIAPSEYTFLASAGHNLIGDATGCDYPFIGSDLVGTENAPIDPMLGPLADNGGPTQTHALLPGSPAIDGGSPDEPGTSAGSCEVTDQRGVYRPLDWDGDGAAVCDIGAFETALPVLVDIKPGNEGNTINPGSRGVISVAILGSVSFDVADVNGETVAFGPGGAGLVHKKGPHTIDINRDGFMDLVAHFGIAESDIAAGDERACVTGETLEALPFEGCDSVRTVPAVRDETGRCRFIPANTEVDDNGCSQEQFCNSITANVRGKGRDLYQAFLACLTADWQDDEPLSNRPEDCRFDRASMGCVASGS